MTEPTLAVAVVCWTLSGVAGAALGLYIARLRYRVDELGAAAEEGYRIRSLVNRYELELELGRVDSDHPRCGPFDSWAPGWDRGAAVVRAPILMLLEMQPYRRPGLPAFELVFAAPVYVDGVAAIGSDEGFSPDPTREAWRLTIADRLTKPTPATDPGRCRLEDRS